MLIWIKVEKIRREGHPQRMTEESICQGRPGGRKYRRGRRIPPGARGWRRVADTKGNENSQGRSWAVALTNILPLQNTSVTFGN